MRKMFVLGLLVLISTDGVLQSQTEIAQPLFRIRTITAGVNLKSLSDLAAIESAIAFLEGAKQEFETAGYEVQTLRIATQPLHSYMGDVSPEAALTALQKIDQLLTSKNVLIAIGPAIADDTQQSEFAAWAARLIRATNNLSLSLSIASQERGIHRETVVTAAETMVAISQAVEGGEGNFRFTACANCPSDIPFFPAAYHKGHHSFAIGLESPGLLLSAFKSAANVTEAKEKMKELFEEKLAVIETIAEKISKGAGRLYSGIDVSPAPGLDASIGEAIEMLSGAPFGDASTLSVCAAITDVLKSLSIKKCGYSGLMLPVIEDKVLAQRASEGRYSLQELLLYSSVSGTGLDVIPLPGETPTAKVAGILLDVAALSMKLSYKPLSARLFLIPRKTAGDFVTFENPYLTDCVVMKVE